MSYKMIFLFVYEICPDIVHSKKKKKKQLHIFNLYNLVILFCHKTLERGRKKNSAAFWSFVITSLILLPYSTSV